MYNRNQAVAYAETYWNRPNPAYRYFEVNDCTNFVSQALLAGGKEMELTQSPGQGWWYRRKGGSSDTWSYSWAVAHSLYMHLQRKGWMVSSIHQLTVGDVICYDWEGDGRWNHNTIITQIDSQNQPLVNAHSIPSQHRLWSYQDSTSYSEQTRYAFFHIR